MLQCARGWRRGQRRGGRHWRWLRNTLASVLLLLALQWYLAGSTLDGTVWRPSRALIVTAHPDDEAMFFAPAILALVGLGVEVHSICLSTGNAGGLGRVRAGELKRSYARLGLEEHNVAAIDDPALQDGMEQHWSTRRILELIQERQAKSGPYDMLLTFDTGGVSRHANHAACFEAVREVVTAESASGVHVHAYALETVSIARKFLGLPHAVAQHVALTKRPSRRNEGGVPARLAFLSSPQGYAQALQAMAQHHSQLVWFRYLYVVLSTYMYGNTFSAIAIIDDARTTDDPLLMDHRPSRR